jgi:hypothetical protein
LFITTTSRYQSFALFVCRPDEPSSWASIILSLSHACFDASDYGAWLLLVEPPLPFLFTPGGSLFVLCGTVFVLPVSLVPPIPVFCGPLPAVAPVLVFSALVAPVVPAVFEAPVVVLALVEPPGALEPVPAPPPQPTIHSATASKSSRVDICRIESPLYSQASRLRSLAARATSIERAA